MSLNLYSKESTDLLLSGYLPLAGGTMSGGINLSASGIIFSDSSVQTTAATAFTGGAVTSAVYWQNGTINTSLNNGYFLVQDSSSGAYGVLYQNGLEVGDGTSTLYIHAQGITFADSSVQTTAVNGSLYLPLSGGTMSGSLTLGGDMNLGGYNITDGNFNSSAGQVNCQNLTLTNGDSGVITFSDGSVQTTAASGGGSADYNAVSYLSFCVNLAFLFQPGSWNYYSTPNQFPFASGNLNQYSYIGLLNNIGVTQDGVNFYPFDSITAGSVTFQASTFTSFDNSNYIYLAFKDSSGTWHTATSCIIFSP